jgi:hypothetical protein
MHIDAVLDRLISQAIDHIADGEPAAAVATLIQARQRAETWGAAMRPRTNTTVDL